MMHSFTSREQTRSNPPRPLVSESSIPAVPEFSMPPSSGSTPAPKKKSEKSSNGGRFKIVFKGNTTSEQEVSSSLQTLLVDGEGGEKGDSRGDMLTREISPIFAL